MSVRRYQLKQRALVSDTSIVLSGQAEERGWNGVWLMLRGKPGFEGEGTYLKNCVVHGTSEYHRTSEYQRVSQRVGGWSQKVEPEGGARGWE